MLVLMKHKCFTIFIIQCLFLLGKSGGGDEGQTTLTSDSYGVDKTLMVGLIQFCWVFSMPSIIGVDFL